MKNLAKCKKRTAKKIRKVVIVDLLNELREEIEKRMSVELYIILKNSNFGIGGITYDSKNTGILFTAIS